MILATALVFAAAAARGQIIPIAQDRETLPPATPASSIPLSVAHPPVMHFNRDRRSFYPAYAMRHSETGTAYFVLDIDAAGNIAKCKITRSSGSASLDEATCPAAVHSLYFDPAVDAQGHSVGGTFASKWKWVIPFS